MIQLQKTNVALNGVSANYEWENQIITKDNCTNYWYCEPMFKGCQFNSLKDIKKALQLFLDKGKVKPSKYELMINGIDC